jgi:sugar phosphate isomerase/epimerase
MRLGIGSYTYPWAIGVSGYPPRCPMKAVDLVERAAELGVRIVQIADNLPLHELSGSEIGALGDRADRLGVSIQVGTRGIEPDHLRAYLQLAQRFHSPILRVVIDTVQQRPAEAEIVRTLRALVPEIERAGVVLAIENHDRFTARTLVGILKRIDSGGVGVCLDTVNSFGALEGPEVVLDVLGPWVVNLHVKDFSISRIGHKMGFTIEGRPAGQGRLDVMGLLDRLHELGRDPDAILELWTLPEDTLAQTIGKEARWAAESITYLRTLIPG